MHVPLVERVYGIPMLVQKERTHVVDKNLVIIQLFSKVSKFAGKTHNPDLNSVLLNITDNK